MSLLGLLLKDDSLTPVPPDPTIPGQPYEGGFYVGDMKEGPLRYRLITAPRATEVSRAFKTTASADLIPSSVSDGYFNSWNNNDAAHPAVQYCLAYPFGGYGGGYLGSRDEHELAYRNLKPLTDLNNVTARAANVGGGPNGVNVNSDPEGAAYTTIDPAQTANELFRGPASVGGEEYNTGGPAYWTSTEAIGAATSGIGMFYTAGNLLAITKTNSTGLVRPMRRKLIDPLPDLKIGDAYEGGFYAGITVQDGVAYRLIVATQADRVQMAFRTTTGTDPANSLYNGAANTQALNTADYLAHTYCLEYTGGGFNDWYMPALYEARLIYQNFKPTTISNGSGVSAITGEYVGINYYSYPKGTFQTATHPTRTEVTDFQSGGPQAFPSTGYILTNSMSPLGTASIVGIACNSGIEAGRTKTTAGLVCPVRKVPFYKPPEIGEAYEGGFYAGDISVGGVEYRLVVADVSADVTGLAWQVSPLSDVIGTSRNDGVTNTNILVALGNCPAATYCRNHNGGGHNDWYLGGADEVEICYRNFKPTTQPNTTGARVSSAGGGVQGSNGNSVPPYLGYGTSDPLQTTLEDFKSTGSQAFQGSYWTSTQAINTATSAMQQAFNTGAQSNTVKTNTTFRVRPMRRVPK